MTEIEGYSRYAWTDGTKTRDVYTAGSGPVLVILHEMPRIDDVLILTANRFIAEGFTVFLPNLYGEPLKPRNAIRDNLEFAKLICLEAEFRAIFGGKRAQVSDWIESLIAKGLQGKPDDAPVGLLGLCFSGGFALAGAVNASVAGAVACEPSLPGTPPYGFGRAEDIGVAVEDVKILKARIDADQLQLRAFNFAGDELSPRGRMCALARTFPRGFDGWILDENSGASAKPGRRSNHSVITHQLIDDPGQPTREVLDYIIGFFKWRLLDPHGPAPALNISQARDVRHCCQAPDVT